MALRAKLKIAVSALMEVTSQGSICQLEIRIVYLTGKSKTRLSKR